MKAIMRDEREMKDSGIEWIGKIPVEQSIVRNKYLIKFIKGKIPKNQNTECKGIPYVGATDLENSTYTTYTEDNDIPTCSMDDVLILWDGARAGLVGVGKEGALSSTMVKCVFNTSKLYPKFWYWYLKGFEKFLLDQVHGTTIPHMNSRYIDEIGLVDWTLSDQQLIANYLDDRCSKIDAIIAESKASIEEYKELKQAVIYEAVTKGLDKNVEMKDSGYEWIGEMPRDWHVVKLKRLCESISDGTHFSPELVSNGMPYVTAGDIHGIGIDFSKTRNISFEDYEKLKAQGCQPHKDDVLIVKDGATTGRVGLMNEEIECVTLSSVAMLRHNHRTIPQYLMYLMESEVLQFQIRKSMAGSAMPRTTLTKLMNYFAILCPLEAQRTIINYLDIHTEKFNELISQKQSFIEDLEAYKKSLIYEVVTGKRKVVE